LTNSSWVDQLEHLVRQGVISISSSTRATGRREHRTGWRLLKLDANQHSKATCLAPHLARAREPVISLHVKRARLHRICCAPECLVAQRPCRKQALGCRLQLGRNVSLVNVLNAAPAALQAGACLQESSRCLQDNGGNNSSCLWSQSKAHR
jgi:hypothetical protein